MKSKVTAFFAALPLVLAAVGPQTLAWAQTAPRLYVGGQLVATTPDVSFSNGLLLGPWADCARAAGASAHWSPAEETLTITSVRGRAVRVQPGSSFSCAGETLQLPVAARIVNGELVGPLKPLFEALECVLDWEAASQSGRVWGRVLKLEARGDEAGVAVTVVTSLPAKGVLATMQSPRRAFVDFPSTYLGSQWPEVTYLNECGVLRLRCAQYEKKPPVVRIVTDLRSGAPAPSFEPREDGCGGRLLFGKLQGNEPVLDRRAPRLLKVLSGSPQPDTAIVTAFLTDPVDPLYDVLRQPYRVIVDLAGAEVTASGVTPSPLPFVSEIKLMEQGRLVLYMDDLVPFKINQLSDPDRLQIVLKRDQLSGKKIMVDAGHGGKDSGARGRYLLEKDINLDVARRTVTRLGLMGAQPFLTRDTDVFVDLYARPRMTNALPADLFVSIHCNAFRWDKGSGTGTYYCHPQSKGLATVMQDALWPQLGRRDGGVHQARFCVVRETQIPAVLVELLFIDNSVEEALLAKPEVRQAAAVGVSEGLRRYLEGTASPAPAVLTQTDG